MIGVVINYFNPTSNKKLFAQSLLCISSYLENKDCYVLLSDGSGILDEEMLALSKKLNFKYLCSKIKLGFAEGYNQGIDFFTDVSAVKFVVLSANDIIVNSDTIEKLVSTYNKYVNTGCVIPYLSESDYHLQNAKFSFRDRVVPIMTLNCNLFLKEDLINIGKVPTYLSGYFNDIVMSAQLFQLNKSIVIVKDVVVTHLARRTVSIASSANFNADKTVFVGRHADLSIKKDDFVMDAAKFSNHKGERFYGWLQKNIPFRFITDRFYYYRYNLEVSYFKWLNRFK